MIGRRLSRLSADLIKLSACRAGLAVIGMCFIGSGIGTLYGQAPQWPDQRVWASAAFVSAAASLLYASLPGLVSLRTMTSIVFGTALLRSVGYATRGGTSGLAWAGAAAWALIAVYALRTHSQERKHHIA